ncbi:MAG: transposase [Treponema sp.]|jgi:REP element-mobilizing transposase RayT|nr:transposase [Treponema sp.]
MYSPAKIGATIKSMVTREICANHSEVKKNYRGEECWTDGHFIRTVSKEGNEYVITTYIKPQGTEKHYKQLCKVTDESQPSLFDSFSNKHLQYPAS